MSLRVRILGLDPGISRSGYGVVDYIGGQAKLVECGVIETKAKSQSGERLHTLYSGFREVIRKHKPELLAVEDSFLGKNFKSAKILGGAKAAALLAGAEYKLPSREYSPREIKQAVVGKGAASKAQVQFMVKNHLRLKQIPTPEDASDALAVALCCSFRLNSKGRK